MRVFSNIKIYICILTCLFCHKSIHAQDIHFSQIQESPLWLNPANAGSFDGYFRAIANYRNQWASMGNAFQTMAVSIDAVTLKTRKGKGYLGLGMYVFNDKAGVAKIGSTQAQFHLSAIVKLSKKSKMAGAAYIGYNQSTANFSALTFGNQFNGKDIDNSLTNGEVNPFITHANLDAGVGFNYEFSNAKIGIVRDNMFTLKIGGASHHINKPVLYYTNGSNYKLPIRFTGNVQAKIEIKDSKISFLPSVIYLSQASASEINIGTFIRYRLKNATKITGINHERGINFGLYYRVKDAIVPQINLDMGKYAIGLSYDMNISQYRQVSKTVGGFEIYLKFISLSDGLFKRRREYGL